jgi:hypothetical protein
MELNHHNFRNCKVALSEDRFNSTFLIAFPCFLIIKFCP